MIARVFDKPGFASLLLLIEVLMARKSEPFFFDPDKPGSEMEFFSGTVKSLHHEEPLPCVLICGAFIDRCLRGLLRLFLVDGTTSDALFNECLAEYSARAKMCYCLGLIGKKMFQDVMCVGEIRNEFAHSHVYLSFDTPSIAQKCDKLSYRATPVKVIDPKTKKQIQASDAGPRGKFISICLSLIIDLVNSQNHIIKQKPWPHDDGTVVIVSQVKK